MATPTAGERRAHPPCHLPGRHHDLLPGDWNSLTVTCRDRNAESATTTPSRNEQVLATSTTVLATDVDLSPCLMTT